jgi:hypothetical protein
MGCFEDAQKHFESALETNARMGALPWVVRTQYDYARMLLTRAHPCDRQRAFQLLAAAHETSQQLGMNDMSERSATLMGGLVN